MQRFLAEAGAEPGGVVIAPDERDVRLLLQVVDDAVAARSAVPAVAGDDQLVDGQVAHRSHGQVDQVQAVVMGHQGVDQGVVVGGPALRGRLDQQFHEQVVVARREDAAGPLQGIAPGQRRTTSNRSRSLRRQKVRRASSVASFGASCSSVSRG